jgi:hypothetical protein
MKYILRFDQGNWIFPFYKFFIARTQREIRVGFGRRVIYFGFYNKY